MPHHPERRILLVAGSNMRRGAEVFTELLAAGLTARGWEAQGVALGTTRSQASVGLEPLTPLAPREMGRFNLEVAAALRRRVAAYRPSVVLANGGPTLRYGVPSVAGTGSKLAYVAIGESSYWVTSAWSRALNRFLLDRTDLIVCVSKKSLADLVALQPAVAGRSHVVYNAATSAGSGGRPARRGGPLRLVMVGSLSSEKDPLMAVEAVARVPGASLRVVGGGPLRGEAANLAERVGAGARIEFVGVVNDVAPHYEWADALILTSRTEGLPGVILEAASAGIPAIAVGVGGVPEAVVSGETGVVVPRDVGALVAALEGLGRDRDRLERMGKAAAARVEELFSIEGAVDRYSDLLETAL